MPAPVSHLSSLSSGHEIAILDLQTVDPNRNNQKITHTMSLTLLQGYSAEDDDDPAAGAGAGAGTELSESGDSSAEEAGSDEDEESAPPKPPPSSAADQTLRGEMPAAATGAPCCPPRWRPLLMSRDHQIF
jgi:hypothetical protein